MLEKSKEQLLSLLTYEKLKKTKLRSQSFNVLQRRTDPRAKESPKTNLSNKSFSVLSIENFAAAAIDN